jgi:hypothetical protein
MSPNTNAIRVMTPDIWIDGHPRNGDVGIAVPTSSSSHSSLPYVGPLAGMHGTYEMPVMRGPVEEDVDDRTYCFCDGVAYGEMITCDGLDCEWELVRDYVIFFSRICHRIDHLSLTVTSRVYWTYHASPWRVVL